MGLNYRKAVNLFNCGLCDKSYDRRQTLQTHIRTVHDKIRFKCNSCNYEATQISHLYLHRRNVHEGKTYECNICGKTFTQKTHVNTHKKNVHMTEKIHNCESCEYKTSDKGNMKKHINSIHNNLVYPCSLCEYKASASQSIKNHMISIHNQGVLICSQCSEKFGSQNAKKRLKQHMINIHNFIHEKRNQPNFKNKLRKLNHIKQSHKPPLLQGPQDNAGANLLR